MTYLEMMKANSTKKRPLALIISASVLGLVLVLAAALVVWALMASQATSLALDSLASDEQITVTQDQWLAFQPKNPATLDAGTTSSDTSNATISVGFIFYPGARIDYLAYGPLIRPIAQAGYLAVVVPMPLNLAILDIKAADRVRAAYPQISHWVVAGHSLGGAMAAQYLSESLKPASATPVAKQSRLAGLVLWGAYSSTDLSQLVGIKTLSISASLDGFSTPAKIQEFAKNLPGQSSTTFKEIDGGNHAQFGSYGVQPGDLRASISPAEQRKAVVQATIAFLSSIK